MELTALLQSSFIIVTGKTQLIPQDSAMFFSPLHSTLRRLCSVVRQDTSTMDPVDALLPPSGHSSCVSRFALGYFAVDT